VDDEAATAVEDGAEEVERAGDVEIADIDMPVLMGQQRLDEPVPFLVMLGECPASNPALLRTR